MSFLYRFFVLFCLTLAVAACGDTKFNGNHECQDRPCNKGPTCSTDADCGTNQMCTNAGKCEAKVTFDCRKHGGCASDQVCNQYTGACEKPPQCLPDCTGRECGSDGCGGQCGQCGNGQSCTALGECEANAGNDCRQVGCPVSQTCNTGTGVCENPNPGGAGECEVASLSGVEFTLYASGISSLEAAESGWSAPIKSVGGKAKFSAGGYSLVAFNAKRSDGLWAYGWDGIDPSYVTKIVGDWELRCGSKIHRWTDGPSYANCKGSLQSTGKCLWSAEIGKYRLIGQR